MTLDEPVFVLELLWLGRYPMVMASHSGFTDNYGGEASAVATNAV